MLVIGVVVGLLLDVVVGGGGVGVDVECLVVVFGDDFVGIVCD